MMEGNAKMATAEEQRMALTQVLEKQQKLTASDLQILRNNTAGVPLLSSMDYFAFRMEIELIDAIRTLDETSAKLIDKTNKLTTAILVLTIVGVILAGLQIFLAVHHS
jgi:hypothetical protein